MKSFGSTSYPVLAALGLLAGCSVIGKLGGKSASAPDVPEGAAVTEAAGGRELPQHVQRQVDDLEKHLADKAWAEYAKGSRRLHNEIVHDYATEPYRDAAAARLAELDGAAYKAFGGRVLTLLADGKRVTEGVDEDAATAAAEMLTACESAGQQSFTDANSYGKAVREATATYEKAIARVRKLDPKAFRYAGATKDSRRTNVDVPSELLACEFELAAANLRLAETYTPEVSTGAALEIGCGVVEFLASGVRVGHNKFAPLTFTSGSATFVAKVPCKEVPKRDALPGGTADAIRAFKETRTQKDIVVVSGGKPTVEVDEDDLHTYKHQPLKAYSRKYPLDSNACGDLKVFCEAGGSKGAAAFNQLEFALDRAQANAGKHPDLCKEHLETAKERAEWFVGFRAEMIDSGDWIKDATYRTKKGQKLSEAQLVAGFEAKGKLADDRLLEKYCARPASIAGK